MIQAPYTRSSVAWFGLGVAALTLLVAATVAAAADVECTALPPLPGTPDAAGQARGSETFCNIDFDSDNTAVCPKTWSTSAAALVYDLGGSAWADRRADFERQVCPRGARARDESGRELAVFKHSMNFRDTSGTYAPSILLYDHLSRWLNTAVQVPAAAEFRFDSRWYQRRVVSPGLALASEHPSREMLLAAWQHLAAALDDPNSGDGREFLLDGGNRLWGAALLFTGRRYGPEINGTRESGWGSGQNYDFQRTAPFYALRSDNDLQAAIAAGIGEARNDPAMAEAIKTTPDATQIAWWMMEVLEIVVLDFLLAQQDRIGNIDYQWRWVWLEEGQLRGAPAAAGSPPVPDAVRLRTTWLNDNDAGIRRSYANYARKTGMPDGLRHFNPELYRRLKMLARDMAAQGPVYRAMAANYHLPQSEVEAIASRVAELDRTITADCRAGHYRFDLAPATILRQAEPPGVSSCD